MKRTLVLNWEGEQPEKDGDVLTAGVVQDILIVDLYKDKRKIYRMAISNKDFEHYNYINDKWDKKTNYNNPYRNDLKYAEILDEHKNIIQKYFDKRVEQDITNLIFDAEYKIVNEKIEIKNRKNEQIKENLFDLLPPLPEVSLTNHINRIIVGSNIIYYKRRGKRADFYCCQCGEKYTKRTMKADEVEEEYPCSAYIPMIPKKNASETCDVCQSKGILKQVGYAATRIQSFTTVLFQTASDGTLIIRFIVTDVTRSLHSRKTEKSIEYQRIFLRKGFEKIYAKYTNSDRWYEQGGYEILTDTTILDGYEDEVEKSELKYCPKDLYTLMSIDSQKIKVMAKINAYRAYAHCTQLETLYKLRLKNICRRIIYNNGITREIDKKSNVAADILRLSKNDFKYLCNMVKHPETPNDYVLWRMLQIAEQNKIKEVDYEKLIKLYVIDDRTLNELLKLQSVTKLYNTLERYKSEYNNNLQSAASEYRDYLREREANGDDLTNTIYLRPKSLHENYARLRLEREQKKDRDYKEKMQKKYHNIPKYSNKAKKYYWKTDNFIIRPAKDAGEIVDEGRVLHHCVGSDAQRYMKNFNEGKAYILFLRHTKTPDIQYITIEIEKTVIKQWYGKNDTKPDKDVIEPLLDEFVSRLNGKVAKTV